MRPGRPTSLRTLVRVVLVAVAVGVAGHTVFLLVTTDAASWGALAALRPRYLLLAAALTLVPWLTNTCRTLIWTRFVGLPVSGRDALNMVLATDLGSAVTPTAAGGGYLKLAMLVERGMAPGTAASLMILGSLEDGLFFLFAIPAALTISRSWNLPVVRDVADGLRGHLPVLLGLAVIVTLLPVLLAWRRRRAAGGRGGATGTWARLRRGAADFARVYPSIVARGKARLAATLALTAVQWTARYTVVAALFAAVGVAADPVLLFLLQWMVFTLGTFIPTPGGAGAVEAAFLVVYDPLVPEGLLPPLAAAWRLLTFYALLLGAAGLSLLLTAVDARRAFRFSRPVPNGAA